MIKIDKNLKYGLYFLAAFIGGFVIVKIIKAIKDGDDDDTPKPIEPMKPDAAKAAGLTPLQKKQEELQSLLGFVGNDVDHIIGPKTITGYNKLNLGLGITLSQTTPLSDVQKIIDAIVKKNKIDETSGANAELRARAAQLYAAFRANPTSVLMPKKDATLRKVYLDKTNNRYTSGQETFIYKGGKEIKRENLGVYRTTVDFKFPYYIIFSDNKTNLMIGNPNDWIIK